MIGEKKVTLWKQFHKGMYVLRLEEEGHSLREEPPFWRKEWYFVVTLDTLEGKQRFLSEKIN